MRTGFKVTASLGTGTVRTELEGTVSETGFCGGWIRTGRDCIGDSISGDWIWWGLYRRQD